MQFGILQSSILGPTLFNLYANDLNDIPDRTAFQYAEDTIIMKHCTLSDLDATVGQLNSAIQTLEDGSRIPTYCLMQKKTKRVMITTEMSRVHKLQNQLPR